MLPPARGRRAADALHFAAATAASLIFPFAPHTGVEVYDALTGDRVWEEPWPAADPALPRARHRRARRARSTARCATASRRRRAPSREELEATARERPNVRRSISTGKEVVKVIVVPGKLVNFVVR